MKRYNAVIKYDEWQDPYVEMVESPNGEFLKAEDAFIEMGYVWSFKTASWEKKMENRDGERDGIG